MHEPTLAAFCQLFAKEYGEKTYRKDAPKSFVAVEQKIVELSEKSPVFIKEMVVSSREFFKAQSNFINNPNVHFIFLIRNPHGMMISLYKKLGYVITPDNTTDWFSYKELLKLLTYVQEKSPNRPFVISAEEVCVNPETTIKHLCQHLEIPYLEHALQWQNLGDDFTGQEVWHEIKPQEMTYHWHSDAIKSTGFGTLTQYELDEEGNPTFTEIPNPEHRQMIKQLYSENIDYYQQMLNNYTK